MQKCAPRIPEPDQLPPVAPDQATQRRIFFGISSFHVIATFRRTMFYSYIPIYLRYFLGLDVTHSTLFATLPMIVGATFQTWVWGRLSDRYQRRRTLIVLGEIMAGLGMLLIWYAHTLAPERQTGGYVIIGGLALVEVFWSMSNVSWSALISDVYPAQSRGAIQGKLTSMGGLGGIVGVWTGGLLYDGMGMYYDGWGFHRGVLFFVTAAAIFISIIPMRLVPEGGTGDPPPSVLLGDGGRQQDSSLPGFFVMFLIATIFINVGKNAVAVIYSQYLVIRFAVSGTTLANIINTQLVASILAGLVTGRIGKHMGNGPMLCFGTLASIFSLLMIATAGDIRVIYVTGFLSGGIETLNQAASYTVASLLIPPEKRGRCFALFNAAALLSWGPAETLITGPIIDRAIASGIAPLAAYRIGFFVAASITTVGLVMMIAFVWRIMPRFSEKQALS